MVLGVRLSSTTGLEAVDLSGAVLRFHVWLGSAAFLVRRAWAGASFEVGTPNGARPRRQAILFRTCRIA